MQREVSDKLEQLLLKLGLTGTEHLTMKHVVTDLELSNRNRV